MSQDEEVEVLQSIYDDAFQTVERFENSNGVRSFTVSIPGPHAIQLLVHLPVGYPSSDPPVAEVYESFGLTQKQRDQIIEDLATIFERSSGQVCLYEWIESVREAHENGAVVDDDATGGDASDSEGEEQTDRDAHEESFQSDPQNLRPRVDNAHRVRDPEREARLLPQIYHGKPLIDRKSTFVAHAVRVTCVEDVRSFLAILLDDRKIARATHNMLAYRIVGDFVIKDNDEDGEDGAGSKMSHLLELTKAENVAVVVTRWYGGIKLGPDRFKHINTAAREALEEGGFLSSAVTQKGKKNKK
ncbi:TPA: hypothetical protein N0F65_002258 [Lagenidium giganteum]|uniref:RWD domain-containing protein n=1 Tax=Lagenidium giganteum TaxID=4803 RepID=A0AAV2YQZ0_9STRA|nr:TPA: hypothetical protein N0F65_002258 [Lagenidium giganteum]